MNLFLPVRNAEAYQRMVDWLCHLPHTRILDMQHMHSELGRATMMLPWQDRLVGNRNTGVLHGGVVTSLIDNTSGLAVFSLLEEHEHIATLDLRIDYLKPATPQLAVYCQAECYKLGSQIAFTRATAYQENSDQPVAYSVGTFMRVSAANAQGEGR